MSNIQWLCSELSRKKNGETIFFDELIPKIHFIKLVSCSLYFFWHNLTRAGIISFKSSGEVIAKIYPGFYTVDTLTKELTKSVKSLNRIQNLKIEADKLNSVLKFSKKGKDFLKFCYELALLIGIDDMIFEFFSKRLNRPST